MRNSYTLHLSRFLSVSALIFLFIFLSGCSGDSCNPSSQNYVVEGYSAQSIRYVELEPEGYLRPEFDVLDNSEEVSWTTYGIHVIGVERFFTADASPEKRKGRLELFPSAYACSPGLPQTTQTVTAFTVTSDNDFSEDYPAGTNISVFFRPVYTVHRLVNNYETIPEYLVIDPVSPRQIFLDLLQQPEFERHNFTISISLSDGSIFEFQTGDVYLTEQ